ncbi:MAG: anti-sigma-F factor Fin [Dethiobacteria bacterium]|nr:anti-sigma-F factor Fin family protein [Bacillota bacterium]
MKATYICDSCQEVIGTIEDESLDEEKLGLSSLTLEEKEDIISYSDKGTLIINSLCDYCIEELGLEASELKFIRPPEIH